MDKPIKIVSASWHVPHHAALFGIPNTEWYLIVNNVKRWNWFARPLPKNVHWIPYYEKGKYDIAVLDVDQQCVDPRIGKGQLYKALNEEIQDIPKIVINHGSPCWPENWESAGHKRWTLPKEINEDDRKKALEFQRKFLVEGGKTLSGGEILEIDGMEKMVGRNKMVVNSFKAREQWGWGKVIWHGLNPDDWLDLPKEPRSVSMISTAGLDYYYGRDFLNSMMNRLSEDFRLKHTWISHPGSWTIYDSDLLGKEGGFTAYRNELGRSMVFFNPTRESPMPRSRTEAMFSGCCIVTTPHHDANKFINLDVSSFWKESEGIKEFIAKVDEYIFTEGVNGIIIPENPLAVAALINHLVYDIPETTVKIGQCGKETAKKLFNQKRYNDDWTELLKSEIKKGKK